MLAGLGIGCAETAVHAAVPALAREELRGSGFGLLAAIQSLGNLAASTIAGILWTAASPTIVFVFVAAAMAAAVLLLIGSVGGCAPPERSTLASGQ